MSGKSLRLLGTSIVGALLIAALAYWISRPGASMVGPSVQGAVVAPAERDGPAIAEEEAGNSMIAPAVITPLPGPGTAETSSAQSLLIGVVRGDGSMVPLAARAPTSELWTAMSGYASHNPGAIRIRDPASLPPRDWMFYPADRAAPRPMTIQGIQTVPAHCEQQEVLATDARPAESAERKRPAGVATYGSVALLPIEDAAGQPDDASRRAVRLIVEITQALEADLVAQPSARLSVILPEQRRQAPVVIDRLYRARHERQQSYYFEAHKAYGVVQVYTQGWVVSTSFGTSLVRISSGVSSGGETARASGQPLGSLYGTIWIMEMRYYEGSSYDLVDLSRPGQVISVPTGGC